MDRVEIMSMKEITILLEKYFSYQISDFFNFSKISRLLYI